MAKKSNAKKGQTNPSDDWEEIARAICAESKKYDLKECPWCKTSEFLYAGHKSSTSMSVECMKCRCTGPIWGLMRVTDDEGYLFEEIQQLVDGKEWPETRDALDSYLLAKAIADWNNR